MKGTILDFLKLASENPEMSKELVELAARYDFTFTDELSDDQLEAVAGGLSLLASYNPVAYYQPKDLSSPAPGPTSSGSSGGDDGISSPPWPPTDSGLSKTNPYTKG